MRKMFSERQIQAMIGAGVAVGATKLYAHDVVFDNEDGEILIITPHKESFVGKTIFEVLDEVIYLKATNLAGNNELIVGTNGSSEIYTIFDSSSDISVSEEEITADTITAL